MDDTEMFMAMTQILGADNAEMMSRLPEINRFLAVYKNAVACMNSGSRNWRRDMLVSLRPQIKGEKAHKLDFLIKIMELDELMRRMKDE